MTKNGKCLSKKNLVINANYKIMPHLKRVSLFKRLFIYQTSL